MLLFGRDFRYFQFQGSLLNRYFKKPDVIEKNVTINCFIIKNEVTKPSNFLAIESDGFWCNHRYAGHKIRTEKIY